MLAAVFGGFFFYEKHRQKKEKEETLPSAQEFLRVEDIRYNTICLGDGEYRAAIECGSINYFLLSMNEQYAIEQSFSRYIAGLTRNVQFQIQTRQVDMRWAITQIRGNSQKQNNAVLQGYADNLAKFLEDWSAQRSTLIRKNYIVVSSKNEKPEEAYGELNRLAQTTIDALSRMGVKCKVLNTQELLDVLYVSQNKERASYAPGPSKAEELGYMSLLVEGNNQSR
ncbi:hypothetical protein F9B85_10610 [Heliorestis acidaminivorans]|uniref:Uncharacterized protein n=1 Tax=Heliorestis acidaminivorans TaxID=553427 RepID=A0A6I0F1G0_9FIRM|nr:hypothetical protein [Heliorestis acidaminivorans]KAB2951999.1 hypothetical protein F9B85_10610 [Heliorestis acidaminivorans]